MDYNTPLIDGHFLKRYKRFFADVMIDKNETVIAHVANTGSLKGLCDKPRPCRLSPSTNPERKLKFTLEQIKTETSWVGVNTHLANQLAWEAFTSKSIPHWLAYSDAVREVKISKETRLDMKLCGPRERFIEVKSVTLAENGVALFPDGVTTRGQKHLEELMKLVNQGASAELVFVIQRSDCLQFQAATAIDPEYARLLKQASQSGVQISAYAVDMNERSIAINTSHQVQVLTD
jgi:sugar fermentation stimulation protein A